MNRPSSMVGGGFCGVRGGVQPEGGPARSGGPDSSRRAPPLTGPYRRGVGHRRCVSRVDTIAAHGIPGSDAATWEADGSTAPGPPAGRLAQVPAMILRGSTTRRVHRAFKARRRTELGLLVAASVIIVAAYALMIVGNTAKAPADVVPLMLVMLALGGVAHIANRIFVPNAIPVDPAHRLPAQRARLRDDPAHRPGQQFRTPSVELRTAAGGVDGRRRGRLRHNPGRDPSLPRPRPLPLPPARRRAVCLLLLPWCPTSASTSTGPGSGSRRASSSSSRWSWPRSSSCIFFASYFAEKRELLTIPTARFGNRLVVDPRPLVPILLAWGFAIGVMSLEHDIGFSAMLFTLFIGMLWVTTGRTGYLVLGVILFAVGAYLAGRYLSQTHIRVETWLDPWKVTRPATPATSSGRPGTRLGSGGIGGSGLGLGLRRLPDPRSQHRLHLRRHRRGDGPARLHHGGGGLPPAGGSRPAHRPGRPVRVRQAHRGRA